MLSKFAPSGAIWDNFLNLPHKTDSGADMDDGAIMDNCLKLPHHMGGGAIQDKCLKLPHQSGNDAIWDKLTVSSGKSEHGLH